MPPEAPPTLKRLDSKVDELSYGKSHLQNSTFGKRHGLYLPAGFRHELYAELLPELFIHDLSEIENAFRLRIAFAGGRNCFEDSDDDETEDQPYNLLLHPELADHVRQRRILCASKAKFLLAIPEAVATIRGLLMPDTFLYIKATHLGPCAIVGLLQLLNLSRVILYLRTNVEHNVFLRRFFQAAQRADLRVEKLISLYGGCAGYNWACSVDGHQKVVEYGNNIWAQEGEEAAWWFRCNSNGPEEVGCWCKGESQSETNEVGVNRREIIASNTKISESYRGFLAWLQADEDEEPQESMIEWLSKSGFEL